jgi:hypothetical protein
MGIEECFPGMLKICHCPKEILRKQFCVNSRKVKPYENNAILAEPALVAQWVHSKANTENNTKSVYASYFNICDTHTK